jgi:hypothetical protein
MFGSFGRRALGAARVTTEVPTIRRFERRRPDRPKVAANLRPKRYIVNISFRAAQRLAGHMTDGGNAGRLQKM